MPNDNKNLEGYIKGDLAESIVSRLFRALGFQVKYNGIEVNHAALLYLKDMNKIHSDLIRKKSFLPDLIIFKEANETSPLGFCKDIEIKYRKSGEINLRKLADYPEDTHFILVDSKNFWSVSRNDLKNEPYSSQKTLKFNSLRLLEDDVAFLFTEGEKQLINLYKNYTSLISKISLQETLVEE